MTRKTVRTDARPLQYGDLAAPRVGAAPLAGSIPEFADIHPQLSHAPSDGQNQRRTYVDSPDVARCFVVETVAEFRARRRLIIGLNIKLARRIAGVSQEEFAALLKVARTQLSDWETGKHEPKKNLGRIAAKLGQPLEFFTTEHSAADVEAMLARTVPEAQEANG